ncbi:MAG TPA: hypothetical protein VG860_18280 [Terriglobia bacterium]|jgi:hypothetical protein|nr:hypothetical protein [Terriglobia bacterium]
MKRTLSVWTGLIALLCALAIPVLHGAFAKPAPAEHPNYHDAINELRDARKKLETAEADGYGHRDKAMHAIDRAIEESNQALAALH